ncbi:patatin [Algibacter amylolyticus]|uniref:Patatin n=1 Tax=Algibacter amylolyticus TaxID=1608400 RepID=A0A5M7B460_9FLAO|nr:patatin-like phospholipase family protein [Algibacter amylolyticus]KAA5824386.1 patatin [Algibacter amylolyticus]MBB5269557.1 patatin-like phospholipase/acyl hydrolase [Algibacter amylolyticus]TSJ75159.1 patatin [Algibacter amylolyticus]
MSNNQPKRILALDGGGIRGAITLGFLERIETILREREGNPNLKLCEYYDLIGGTSTGAIIASGLAIGMTASEIKDLYLNIGDKIFGVKRSWLLNPLKRYKAEFDFKPLENALKEVFGDITMGSDKIKTGLCCVTKRADTLSTWPILNHPEGKFFEQNKDILLRNVIRASAAAPSYFIPQKIDVGNGEIGAFIDGGVSLANNPALQLFLVATLKEYPYKWETGEDNLSLLSLGTGTFTKRYNAEKISKKGLLGWATLIPEMFMEDANYLNQTILQYLSNSPVPRKIDSEILDLKNDLLTPKPALSYVRYNVMLEKEEMNMLGLNYTEIDLMSLREMSDSKNKDKLYEIGSKSAAIQIKPEHIV